MRKSSVILALVMILLSGCGPEYEPMCTEGGSISYSPCGLR